MILTLQPGEQDWKFGDVLRLRTHDRRHEYLYMFVYRKPRVYVRDGINDNGNDRGFVAFEMGVPDCSGCSSFDHQRTGEVSASFGGLPREEAWQLVDGADL